MKILILALFVLALNTGITTVSNNTAVVPNLFGPLNLRLFSQIGLFIGLN